jgi:hypothetical protein
MVDNAEQEYLYALVGYDTNGNIVSEEPAKPCIGDGTPMFPIHHWNCNGIDYTFSVILYSNESFSLGTLQLEGPFGTSYYEYLRPFELPCAQGENADWPYFNEAYSFDYANCANLGSSPNVLVIDNIPIAGVYPVDYYDRNGVQITTSTVYGLQKKNWRWPVQITIGNIAAPINFISTYPTTDNILNYLNTFSDVANLINQGIIEEEPYCSAGGGVTNYLETTIDDATKCFQNNTNSDTDPDNDVDVDTDGDIDIFDDYSAFINCLEAASGATTGNEQISQLMVSLIGYNESTIIQDLHKPNFYDQSGNWQYPTFSLNPGLHYIQMISNSGKILNYYKEIKNTQTTSQTMASFCDITIYEVPIIGNDYKLNFSTSANVEFKYKVYTSQSQLLYSEEYDLETGFNSSLPVEIEMGIPSGLIIHQFLFSDGSVKTVTTIK